jgi:UDP-glucuronate 4-epimerase
MPATKNNNWIGDQPDPATSKSPWRVYNIGNNRPVKLMDYIAALEKALEKKAKINFLPLQPGDVPDTYANVDNLNEKFNYKPSTSVAEGVSNFVKWYNDYYKK